MAFTWIEWVSLVGAMTSFILAAIQIRQFIRDRSILKIPYPVGYWFIDEKAKMLHLRITIDVTNKGRLATTVSKVYLEYQKFPNDAGGMLAIMCNHGNNFVEKRIEANDRRNLSFHATIPLHDVEEEKKLMNPIQQAMLTIYTSNKNYEIPAQLINGR